MNTKTRRTFLRISALATAGTLSYSSFGRKIPLKSESISLGLASYSCRNFSQDEAIEMAVRAGLSHVCFKSMHLPLDASLTELKEARTRVEAAGLKLVSGGVIYMSDNRQVDRAFEYAKNAGMEMIVGVPEHALLDYVEKKINIYNIKVAIHNHGPGDERYPTPGSVYQRIRDRDPRFGICLDIGHTVRVGDDPVKAIHTFQDRIFDLHLKDVDQARPEGKELEIGRGVIDIPNVLKALTEVQYQGYASFEYEKDPNDPLPGLCESVGYVKGCMEGIRA